MWLRRQPVLPSPPDHYTDSGHAEYSCCKRVTCVQVEQIFWKFLRLGRFEPLFTIHCVLPTIVHLRPWYWLIIGDTRALIIGLLVKYKLQGIVLLWSWHWFLLNTIFFTWLKMAGHVLLSDNYHVGLLCWGIYSLLSVSVKYFLCFALLDKTFFTFPSNIDQRLCLHDLTSLWL